MKFISLQELRSASTTAAQRFPVAILGAALAFLFSLALNHFTEKNPWTQSLFFSALLLIPIGTAASLWFEGQQKHFSFIIHVAGGLVLWGLLAVRFYSVVGDQLYFDFAHLGLAAHLLVAFSLFEKNDNPESFWQFNRVLFVRFIQAFVFSATLFAGIVAILFSLKTLFGLNIDHKIYMDLWCACAFLFNTFFFLSAAPHKQDLSTLQGKYPPLLKKFVQYVVVPLLVIYLAILYAYAVKIGIRWKMPQGILSYMISGASIVGIFAFLFVYPVRDRFENSWIRGLGHWLFIVILPLLALMGLGLFVRVQAYGVTESRYMLVTFLFWLVGISFYFIASREKHIRMIPISLCLCAAITGFGPWGSGSLSERSQKQRLLHLFEAYGILKGPDSKIEKASRPIAFEDAKSMSSILDYLIDRHSVASIHEWLPDSLTERIETYGPHSRTRAHIASRAILETAGVRHVSKWQEKNPNVFNYFTPVSLEAPIEIAGYSWFVKNWSPLYKTEPHQLGKSPYFAQMVNGPPIKIRLLKNTDVLADVDVEAFVRQLAKKEQLNPDDVILEFENEKARVKLRLNSVTSDRPANADPEPTSISSSEERVDGKVDSAYDVSEANPDSPVPPGAPFKIHNMNVDLFYTEK